MPKVTSENGMPMIDFTNEIILTRNEYGFELSNHETPIAVKNVEIRGMRGRLKFIKRLKVIWSVWKFLKEDAQ